LRKLELEIGCHSVVVVVVVVVVAVVVLKVSFHSICTFIFKKFITRFYVVIFSCILVMCHAYVFNFLVI
jgi:uncharacterized membrane protein required for colicin V production